MRIVVEVGSNNGEDTAILVQNADKLYAFEPDPKMFNDLVQRFGDDTRITVLPYAVHSSDGTHTFNRSDGEPGLNSLYDLRGDLLKTCLNEFQVYRDGFQSSVTVETRRLDTIMEENQIPHIDYMWVDAQGNDLIVLQSLGDRIKDLKSGRLECDYKVLIYAGVDNSYRTAVEYLESQGFQHEIDHKHANETTVDVRFWR
jgi:FkbM family methyltransferase